jgi:hypothetical protein
MVKGNKNPTVEAIVNIIENRTREEKDSGSFGAFVVYIPEDKTASNATISIQGDARKVLNTITLMVVNAMKTMEKKGGDTTEDDFIGTFRENGINVSDNLIKRH